MDCDPEGPAKSGARSFTMEGVNCSPTKSEAIGIALLSLVCICAAQKSPSTTTALPGCNRVTGQVLRCPQLGFTYKVPFGWVQRTEDMQESASSPSSSPSSPDKGTPGQPNPPTGKTLLAAFERPPGIPGDVVDSAVIIVVESRSAYPQVKTAADYFGPLADVAGQRGVKMVGDPYSFRMGTRQVVRGDFAGGSDNMPIRQTSLVVLEKEHILSFTFVASSEDDVDALLENLTFTPGSKGR